MLAVQEPTSSIDTAALLHALTALKNGHSARLPAEWTGVAGKGADTFPQVVELNERMALELDRLSRVVGKEGKLTQPRFLGRSARLLA